MWVALIRIGSWRRECVSPARARVNHSRVEQTRIAVNIMPVRVFILPDYRIVDSDHNCDYRGFKAEARVDASSRLNNHYN